MNQIPHPTCPSPHPELLPELSAPVNVSKNGTGTGCGMGCLVGLGGWGWLVHGGGAPFGGEMRGQGTKNSLASGGRKRAGSSLGSVDGLFQPQGCIENHAEVQLDQSCSTQSKLDYLGQSRSGQPLDQNLDQVSHF